MKPAEAEMEPYPLSKAVALLMAIVVVAMLIWGLLVLGGWATNNCRYDRGRTCLVKEDLLPVPLTNGRNLEVQVEFRTSSAHRTWVGDLETDGSRTATDFRDTVIAEVNARNAAAVWRDPAGVERDVAKAIERRFPWVDVTFVRIDPAGY